MFPGETIASGASATCDDCRVTPKLQVCKSNAGFYIGTYCKCGPYSRESVYYCTAGLAIEALETDTWIRRS